VRNTHAFTAALLSAAALLARTSAPCSGFDWSSAGIGAAGGVGAFAIALAGIAGIRRRRLPHRDLITTH
jgi:hypothetical protein